MDHPVTNLQRITLLKVPIDIIPEEEVGRVAREFAESEGHKTIVFLTYAKFMRARRDPEFLGYLHKATLVVPVSKSLETGSRFLKLPDLIRHHPFNFIIRFLGALEEKRRTLYLLGDHHQAVQSIASNMRTSFPGLNLVGRHTGHYSKDKEEPILQAIRKATPTVLLIGPGIPGKEKWPFRQGADLPVQISLFSEETFRIMAGRRKRPSRRTFQNGTQDLHRVVLNPLRLGKIFSYLWFGLLLLVYRLRKKA